MEYVNGEERQQKENNKKIIVGISIFFVLLGAMYIYQVMTLVKYDINTLCPDSIPYNSYTLLIDTTDKISTHQSRFMTTKINELIKTSDEYTRFSVFKLEEKTGGISQLIFDMCKPPDGSKANSIYENKTIANNKFKKRFVSPLITIINEMVFLKTQSKSPIYESISDIYSLKLSQQESPKNTIILFSDLLQNSNKYTVYNNGNGVKNLPAIDMRGDKVHIYFLQRKGNTNPLQNKSLVEAWMNFFNKSNITSLKFKTVRN